MSILTPVPASAAGLAEQLRLERLEVAAAEARRHDLVLQVESTLRTLADLENRVQRADEQANRAWGRVREFGEALRDADAAEHERALENRRPLPSRPQVR